MIWAIQCEFLVVMAAQCKQLERERERYVVVWAVTVVVAAVVRGIFLQTKGGALSSGDGVLRWKKMVVWATRCGRWWRWFGQLLLTGFVVALVGFCVFSPSSVGF